MTIRTREEWNKLEQPLTEVDEQLRLISQKRGLTLTKNYHNWPNRSLTWTAHDGLNRKLEIVLQDNMQSFEIFGYVWFDDVKGQRYIKILNPRKDIHPPLISVIQNEISTGFDRLNKITKDDLKQ